MLSVHVAWVAAWNDDGRSGLEFGGGCLCDRIEESTSFCFKELPSVDESSQLLFVQLADLLPHLGLFRA